MKKLHVFKNAEFGTIRGIELNGEPWLVGKDTTRVFGYKNPWDALAKHVEKKDKYQLLKSQIAIPETDVFSPTYVDIPNCGLTFINKPGIYSLAFYSGMPGAKRVRAQEWIFGEILSVLRWGKSTLDEAAGTKLHTFLYKNKTIRILKVNGELWWILTDLCRVLNGCNVHNTAKKLDDSDKSWGFVQTSGGKQKMIVVNEFGMYKVLFKSSNPEARELADWMDRVVLPIIRKNERVSAPNTLEDLIASPEFGIRLLTELKNEREARQSLEKKLNDAQDKAKAALKSMVDSPDSVIIMGNLAGLLK